MNEATTNIDRHIFVWFQVFSSIGYLTKSEIAGPYGIYFAVAARTKYHKLSRSENENLLPHNSGV